jgi:5'-3' exonuclease
MKHLLIDTSNLFHRCRHTARGDSYAKSALALHMIFNSARMLYKKFYPANIVFIMDSSSWRKKIFPSYKAHRKIAALNQPIDVQEDLKEALLAFDDFIQFLSKSANCVVLKKDTCEADDIIATWINRFPEDEHIIVSSDSDFVQLVKHNVSVYDGIRDIHIQLNGIVDKDGDIREFKINPQGKLKILNVNKNFIPEHNWAEKALFLKCVRGDAGDNIPAAYPGAREKKILECFNNRHDKSFSWVNFMTQTVVDHNKNQSTVAELYKRNVELIDLNQLPNEITTIINEEIDDQLNKPHNKNIGFDFIRFCAKYQLQRVLDYKESYLDFLNRKLN